jgi:hypothetical protein
MFENSSADRKIKTLCCRVFEENFTLDDRIASVLAEVPCLSLRQIVKRVMMSKSTAYRHLTSGMGWKLKHIRWVPHRLTDVEKGTDSKEHGTFRPFCSPSSIKVGNTS